MRDYRAPAIQTAREIVRRGKFYILRLLWFRITLQEVLTLSHVAEYYNSARYVRLNVTKAAYNKPSAKKRKLHPWRALQKLNK